MRDGGPAFPATDSTIIGKGEDAAIVHGQFGMSLRDYFAAAALTGIVAVLHEGIRPNDIPMMAKDCYAVADAMLTERDK